VVVLAAESGHCSDADVFTTYVSPGQIEKAVAQMKANNEEMASVVVVGPSLVGENWMIRSDGVIDLQPKLGGTILR
jgi:hypothetical protein